jgi:dihydroorotase
LRDRTIDAVATDHAPHAVEDKECEWAYARPGMLGLETALSIMLEVFGEDWDLITDRMSAAPARIAGLREHGHALKPGAPANFTLVDPTTWWTVDPHALASLSHNTPYAGMKLPGRVVHTYLRGTPTVRDGKVHR